MANSNNFEKEFDKTIGLIKSGCQQMVDNGFYCTVVDINKTVQFTNDDGEQETTVTYPSHNEASSWLLNLFDTDGLKFKPLPQKALDNMKARGIIPKRQPSEILNIIICGTDVNVQILIHTPEKEFNAVKFIEDALGEKLEPLTKHTDTYNYVFSYYLPKDSQSTVYKERDIIRGKIYTQLEKDGIYVKDDDE